MGNNELSIGEALKILFQKNGLQQELDKSTIKDNWVKIVGEEINAHTVSLDIRHAILFVKMDNAGLRHELSFARDKLRDQLNKLSKTNMLKEVIFV